MSQRQDRSIYVLLARRMHVSGASTSSRRMHVSRASTDSRPKTMSFSRWIERAKSNSNLNKVWRLHNGKVIYFSDELVLIFKKS